MKLTPKIQKAIIKSALLYAKQKRKGSDIPYIIHPYSVAFILSNYTNNEDIIIAGLLHDILEDVEGYTAEDMKRDFGEKITKIVKEVSEEKEPNSKENKKSTWKKRKEGYLKNIRNGSTESMMVCAADKIHNLSSIIKDYKDQGNRLWKVFNSTPKEALWFYNEVLNILKEKLDNEIVEKLEEVCLVAKKEIKT